MQSRVSRFAIALALLGSVGAFASGQSPSSEGRARLTGRVADAMGYSIPKAEILVTNTPLHAESGTDGRFEVAGLPSGPVEVIVRRIGFSPAKIALELGSGRRLRTSAGGVSVVAAACGDHEQCEDRGDDGRRRPQG